MKKSLIALAVLAASGAAMAQSSVSLYGIVDAAYGQVKVTDGVNTAKTTGMFDGGANGIGDSRWGLRGSEDLGNGLKANFNLEQGIDALAARSRTVDVEAQFWYITQVQVLRQLLGLLDPTERAIVDKRVRSGGR